ncbi:MAG TPA: hypothetical protein VIR57_16120 [Chloroflexota bacterium]|jgi:membrane protein DedA with SNARE-associated domain
MNAALFFVSETLGFVATFARTEVVLWLGYAGETAFISQMYWSHPGDRFLGPLLVVAVVGWLVLWFDRWFHVREHIRLWLADHRLRDRRLV